MTLRRAERALIATVALVVGAAVLVDPVARRLSPRLAVDAAWTRSGWQPTPESYYRGTDPWGAPWRDRTFVFAAGPGRGTHDPTTVVVPGPHVARVYSTVSQGEAQDVCQGPYSLGPDGFDALGLGDDLQPGPTTLPAHLLAHAREGLLLSAGLLLWLLPWLRLPRATTRARRLGQLALVAGPPLAAVPWLVGRAPDLSAHLPAFVAVSWRVTLAATLAALVLLAALAARLAAPALAPDGGAA